jgi:Flp pilus assembly pilin Flp
MNKSIITAIAALVVIAVIAASQCLGTTLKGERCKNMTNNASGYCHLHGPK